MARQIARRGPPIEVLAPQSTEVAHAAGGALDRNDKLVLERIGIAKRYPRDLELARRHLAALAPAKADEWGYAWPVKNKKTGKTETIEGPSIKCANAVLDVIDNIDVRIHVIETPDAWVFEVGIFDLERNRMPVRAYRQRRDQFVMADEGRNDDLLFALGQSKAIRNAVVNYLGEMVDFAWQASRNTLLERIAKDTKKFRERIHEQLEAFNVSPERVVQWVGRGEKKWSVRDMAKIHGMLVCVQDGVISADAAWPDRAAAKPPPAPPPPPPREEPPPAEPPAERGSPDEIPEDEIT